MGSETASMGYHVGNGTLRSLMSRMDAYKSVETTATEEIIRGIIMDSGIGKT